MRPEGGPPDVGVEHGDGGLEAPVDESIDHAPTDGPADRLDGAAGHCGRVSLSATASVAVHTPSGDVSCANATADAGTLPPRVWSGLVTSSDATSIVVDTCGDATSIVADGGLTDAGATDAGCVATTIRLEAHAPGLDLSSFPHVRVRVRAKVSRFFACQQALEVTTADAADGDAQNAPGALLLAVNDGGDTLGGSPYGVAHVSLGCSPAPVCNGPGTAGDEYAFDFSDSADLTHRIRVYMGETVPWTLGASSYTIRNLRSFQPTDCDDYWNWAYWIYADPK
jgi:hypothetical protein